MPLAETIVHTREMTVKSAKSTPVESAHSAAVKSTHSAAVETPAAAPAMRPSVGEIWLAERGSAQQSSCDCQSPSYPGPGSRFV